MHERTQRAIARLMFVFCCAVPTILTLLVVLIALTPWKHRRTLAWLESELSADTELVIEIEDFDRPTPNSYDLHQVKVLHPETLNEIAQVRLVQWVKNDEGMALVLHQPELQASELSGAWHLIHDQFLCRPDRTAVPAQISANDLTIHSAAGGTTFDAKAWIEPREQAVEAIVQCTPAEAQSGETIDISIRRDRKGTPRTQWTLDTHGATLRCAVLADYLPVLKRLGSEALFSGVMRLQPDADNWWIDLSGSQFQDIWLDRVFEGNAYLRGKANVQLERCRIDLSKQLSDIAGSFWARNGAISQRLLYASREHFQFAVHPEALPEPNLTFDLIALEFDLNSTQLKLNGICRNDQQYNGFPAGVVLCRDQIPLVQSPGTTIDALQIANVFAPDHAVRVPISDQTRWLMNVLVPPSRPLPVDGKYQPRIRSSSRFQGGPLLQQPPLR